MPTKLQQLLKDRIIYDFNSIQNFRKQLDRISKLVSKDEAIMIENMSIYYTSLMYAPLDVFRDTLNFKDVTIQTIQLLKELHQKTRCTYTKKLLRLVEYKFNYVQNVSVLKHQLKKAN